MKINKKVIWLLIIIVLCIILGYFLFHNKEINLDIKQIPKKINYSDYYHDTVKTLNEKILYKFDNETFTEVGKISSDVLVNLSQDEFLKDGYFKIKDMDYYITYQELEEAQALIIDDHWKNYIPYNESVKTIDKTNLYLNDKLIYAIDYEMNLPIIIKESNYYGVIYNDQLFYVKKDEVDVNDSNNTNLTHTNGFATLVYHFTYDSSNNEEKRDCLAANSTICLSDKVFDEQMKYLKDSNFYTPTMNDVEMFIDGKIQLPEKTVLITIDDGYFVNASIKVLEKYDLHATLFLIGEYLNPDDYKSDSLEIHSHTYALHYAGACPGGQGSPIKCLDREIILADLKKSRDQLNGSNVFCYPFFEYNDYAISLLKEAGFTMAFAGGRQKIKVGSNKMKLSRYGIINTTTLSDFKKIVN